MITPGPQHSRSRARTYKSTLLAMLFALLAGLILPHGVAKAAAPLPQAPTTIDLPLSVAAEGDLVLRGGVAQRTISFPIYPHWKIEAGSELHLALTYSPLLLGDRSTLTISLDGTPLGALRLDPALASGNTLTVALPAIQPANGVLTFSLDASLLTSDAACANPDDPGAYLVVGQSSSLHLNYSTQDRDLKIQEAAQLLSAGQRLPGSKVVFVLPAEPGWADLQAASMIAARLGQLAGPDPLNIDVMAADAVAGADLGNANLVYVGGPKLRDRLASAGLAVGLGPGGDAGAFSLDGNQVPDVEGILSVNALPWSPNSVALVVAGGSDDAVINAARVLLDESRLALLQGPSVRVPADTQLPAKPALTPLADAPTATFEQLGFTDQTLYGVGTRSLTNTVFLPASWQISGDGELTLDVSHSDTVVAQQSNLTVLLNSSPVGTIPLGGGTGKVSTKLTLPRSLWRAGDNVIEYRFNLVVEGQDANCAPQNSSNVWATIYKTSGLHLTYGVDLTRKVDLSLYPYPFSGTGSSEQAASVVLPYTPSTAEQAAGLLIIAGLSRFVPEGDSVPLLITADRDEAARYTNDMIVLGGAERNPVSREINSKLPVVWNGNTAQTLTTQWGVVFPANGQGDLALVQEVVSPWNANRLILDVGYTRPGLAGRVAAAIGQHLYIGKFSGNVLVVDLDGKVSSFDTNAPTAPIPGPTPVGGTTTTTIDTPRTGNGMGALVGLFLALLLLGVVVLLIRNIPRTATAEKAAK